MVWDRCAVSSRLPALIEWFEARKLVSKSLRRIEIVTTGVEHARMFVEQTREFETARAVWNVVGIGKL
jgi:hypothetical protein